MMANPGVLLDAERLERERIILDLLFFMPCQAGQTTDQWDPCELRKWQDIRKMARHRKG